MEKLGKKSCVFQNRSKNLNLLENFALRICERKTKKGWSLQEGFQFFRRSILKWAFEV